MKVIPFRLKLGDCLIFRVLLQAQLVFFGHGMLWGFWYWIFLLFPGASDGTASQPPDLPQVFLHGYDGDASHNPRGVSRGELSLRTRSSLQFYFQQTFNILLNQANLYAPKDLDLHGLVVYVKVYYQEYHTNQANQPNQPKTQIKFIEWDFKNKS